MFNMLINCIKGVYTVEVKGHFPERILNIASVSGIYLHNVRRIDSETISFSVSKKAYEKLSQAKVEGCSLNLADCYGFPVFFRKHRKRLVLFLLPAVFIIVSSVFSRFVWKVEITGGDKALQEKVLKKISDDGVPAAQTEEEKSFFKWRSQLFAIAQDRRLTVSERIEKLGLICGFSCDACRPADWKRFLLSLERMDDGWEQKLADMQSETQKWEIPFEQLLFYLLFRHLPGALDDGRYSERAALCVLLLRTIRAFPSDSMEELVELCRMASSEIEYSDQNIDCILEELEKALHRPQS